LFAGRQAGHGSDLQWLEIADGEENHASDAARALPQALPIRLACCTETTRTSIERSRDWPERMPADAALHQHDETEPQKEKPRHPHFSEMTGLSEHSPSY
jgi:hypothetical protein